MDPRRAKNGRYQNKTAKIICSNCGITTITKANATACDVCRGYRELTNRAEKQLGKAKCLVCNKDFLKLTKNKSVCFECKALGFVPNGEPCHCELCKKPMRYHFRTMPVCPRCVDNPVQAGAITSYFRKEVEKNQNTVAPVKLEPQNKPFPTTEVQRRTK